MTMKNEHVEEKLAPDGHRIWPLTRNDLDPDEIKIYDKVLPKLTNPSPGQLQMLAAYAYAASEFRKAYDNKDLANHLHRCMVYARNGLGPWKPIPISCMELLLDCQKEWPFVFLHLDQTWQVGKG